MSRPPGRRGAGGRGPTRGGRKVRGGGKAKPKSCLVLVLALLALPVLIAVVAR